MHSNNQVRGQVQASGILREPLDDRSCIDLGPLPRLHGTIIFNFVIGVRAHIVGSQRGVESVCLDFDELVVAVLVSLNTKESGGELQTDEKVSIQVKLDVCIKDIRRIDHTSCGQ